MRALTVRKQMGRTVVTPQTRLQVTNELMMVTPVIHHYSVEVRLKWPRPWLSRVNEGKWWGSSATSQPSVKSKGEKRSIETLETMIAMAWTMAALVLVWVAAMALARTVVAGIALSCTVEYKSLTMPIPQMQTCNVRGTLETKVKGSRSWLSNGQGKKEMCGPKEM